LKSQTFDPEQLISTLPSVTRAGLKAAALIAGGALPAKGAGDDTNQQAITDSRAALDVRLAESRAILAKQHLSRVNLLDVLVQLYKAKVEKAAYDEWKKNIKTQVNEAAAPMREVVVVEDAKKN
ncbi:MAG: hypothetical protein ACYTF8_09665, partial [Planctomycetota bacterium]